MECNQKFKNETQNFLGLSSISVGCEKDSIKIFLKFKFYNSLILSGS
ncbi:putative lipoprotein [Leptospira sp. serovar Kenya str. Sh9]|nr:putative lipoprotein [Leptospira sp. serovar Kenya str. Sh9]EMN13569.1 putative lipoprotein [Leptospira borgpetersenii str. Brem 307]EMN56837.1 putative lipoprotein [Leptospira borgpetersenii serovar Javanica str. MK146]